VKLISRAFLAILAITTLSVSAFAAQSSIQLVIDFDGNAERRITTYQCENEDALLEVEYLNASPNFLAIVPVDGEKLIFSNVISGSGVQYLTAQYAWITKGSAASLLDHSAPDAPEVIMTCLEANESP